MPLDRQIPSGPPACSIEILFPYELELQAFALLC